MRAKAHNAPRARLQVVKIWEPVEEGANGIVRVIKKACITSPVCSLPPSSFNSPYKLRPIIERSHFSFGTTVVISCFFYIYYGFACK